MRDQLRLRVILPVVVLGALGLAVGAFAFGGTPEQPQALPALTHRTSTQAAALKAAVAKRTWAEQANGICASAYKDITALGQPAAADEVLVFLPQALVIARRRTDGLEALGAPKSGKAKVARMLALYRRAGSGFQQAIDAFGKKDAAGYVRLISASTKTGAKADGIAAALGASACAKDPFASVKDARSPLERELDAHSVVVVVFYQPDSQVDRLATLEARAGAADVGAGFLAVDVSDDAAVGSLATQYDLRKAPAVVVLGRDSGAVTKISGYADRATVAQAAVNALS